jgi:hypothetical protein
LSGEIKLQTGAFSTSVLTSGYVFYASGVDVSNGKSDISIGQAELLEFLHFCKKRCELWKPFWMVLNVR